MASLRLKFIQGFTDRHGRARYYFRRTGSPRTPLPGIPGSAEFMAAYQAALANEPAPKSRREQSGTLGALAVAYYRSTEYQQLAAVTQVTYRNIIERLRVSHGEKPLAMMQREHVRRLVAEKVATPAAANALLKMMRILMQFAVNEGLRRDDPTLGVRRVKSKSDGFTTWSDSDIAAFEARWPLGTRQHLALMLLLYTGQRGRSDVNRMGPQHIQGGRIAVQQSKTRKRLLIPIHARLRAAIDSCPSGHLTFIAASNGKTYTSASFGNWFADAVAAAGLSGLSAHGLRKGAGRRLAEAGCTPHQIKAVLGHSTLREVARYTEAAEQAGLADAALAKVS